MYCVSNIQVWKMAYILQTIDTLNPFSLLKIAVFWFNLHWRMFPIKVLISRGQNTVQTTFQHIHFDMIFFCVFPQNYSCSQLRCRKFRLDQLIQLQQKYTGGTDAYRCDSWMQLPTGASAAAVCPIRVTQLRHLRRKSAKVFRRYVFSCDQAALQMVLSVCPSLRPSLPPFSLCSHHRIIIKLYHYYQWPK